MNKYSTLISLNESERIHLNLFNYSSTDVIDTDVDVVVDRIEFEYIESMERVVFRADSFEVVFPLSLIIRFEKEILPQILHQRLFNNIRGQKIAPL